MRILLVAPEFPPQLGGMETYAYELACALSALHDVAVLCRDGSDTVPHVEIFPEFADAESILTIVERFRPDVVHLLNAGLSPAIPKLGERNVPVVVTVHGKDYFQPWLASREEVKAALPLAGGVIAVSDFLKKKLVEDGRHSDEVSVILHGVDTQRFRPWRKLIAGGLTILTVTRLVPRKNIEAVLDAMGLLVEEFRNLTYQIVGPAADKDYAARLIQMVERRGLRKHVRFLGEVPERQLPHCYALADLFILLSKEPTFGDMESFGISCLEAFASGIPVVVSHETGIADIIGTAGVALPTGDSRALVESLKELLRNKERRARMGKEARRIAERHTWARCASHTVRVYKKTAVRSRRCCSVDPVEHNRQVMKAHFKRQDTCLTNYPVTVFLELTQNCNFSCIMCSRPKSRRYDPALDMQFPLFKRIADELFPYAEYVDLRGFWESAILRNFEQYLEYGVQFPPKFGLVTNLSSTNRRLWRKWVQHHYFLGVSFDGATKETFEHIRVGADFRQIMRNLKSVVRMMGHYESPACNLKLTTVVQDENYTELPEIVRLAADAGISGVRFIPIQGENVARESQIIKNPGMLQPFLISTLEVGRQLNVSIELGAALGFLVGGTHGYRLKTRCHHPWSRVFIDYRGRVGPCDMLMGPQAVPLGDLKKQGFMIAWNSPAFQDFRRKIHSDERAPQCDWCFAHRFSDTMAPWKDPLR